MFDEANTYSKTKYAEYDQKKIAYSERLRLLTEREQKQLAAKYASLAAARANLGGEDLYYLGMLNWIAENLDGTTAALTKYIAADPAAAKPRRPARSSSSSRQSKNGSTKQAST
jgi:hypothetical protein